MSIRYAQLVRLLKERGSALFLWLMSKLLDFEAQREQLPWYEVLQPEGLDSAFDKNWPNIRVMLLSLSQSNGTLQPSLDYRYGKFMQLASSYRCNDNGKSKEPNGNFEPYGISIYSIGEENAIHCQWSSFQHPIIITSYHDRRDIDQLFGLFQIIGEDASKQTLTRFERTLHEGVLPLVKGKDDRGNLVWKVVMPTKKIRGEVKADVYAGGCENRKEPYINILKTPIRSIAHDESTHELALRNGGNPFVLGLPGEDPVATIESLQQYFEVISQHPNGVNYPYKPGTVFDVIAGNSVELPDKVSILDHRGNILQEAEGGIIAVGEIGYDFMYVVKYEDFILEDLSDAKDLEWMFGHSPQFHRDQPPIAVPLEQFIQGNWVEAQSIISNGHNMPERIPLHLAGQASARRLKELNIMERVN